MKSILISTNTRGVAEKLTAKFIAQTLNYDGEGITLETDGDCIVIRRADNKRGGYCEYANSCLNRTMVTKK